MNKDEHSKITWVVCVISGVIFCLLAVLVISFSLVPDDTVSSDNEADYAYIDNVYVLTPKDKKNANLYFGPNDLAKAKSVDKIVIPVNASIGNTVHVSFLSPESDENKPFANYSQVDNSNFSNGLTINPHYTYPLDLSKSKFIKVAEFKKLYKLEGYLVPTCDRDNINLGTGNVDDSKYAPKLYYLNLAGFDVAYKKKLNITKSKMPVCLGYLNG